MSDGGLRDHDGALAVVVVALFGVVVALGVVAATTSVTGAELDVFRWVNGWPDAIGYPLWVVMQLGGSIIAALVGAIVLWALRGWRGAVVAVATVLVAWFVARVAKEIVGRGRPADFLDVVDTRWERVLTTNGYPSGHACVAFALAALVASQLRGSWRVVPWALAVLVAIGRLYFGAHLPLDVIGGAALGAAIGLLTAVFALADDEERAVTTQGGAP